MSLLPGEKCAHQLCTLEGMGNGQFYVKKKVFTLCPRIPKAIYDVLIAWDRGGGCRDEGIIGNSPSDILLGFM